MYCCSPIRCYERGRHAHFVVLMSSTRLSASMCDEPGLPQGVGTHVVDAGFDSFGADGNRRTVTWKACLPSPRSVAQPRAGLLSPRSVPQPRDSLPSCCYQHTSSWMVMLHAAVIRAGVVRSCPSPPTLSAISPRKRRIAAVADVLPLRARPAHRGLRDHSETLTSRWLLSLPRRSAIKPHPYHGGRKWRLHELPSRLGAGRAQEDLRLIMQLPPPSS